MPTGPNLSALHEALADERRLARAALFPDVSVDWPTFEGSGYMDCFEESVWHDCPARDEATLAGWLVADEFGHTCYGQTNAFAMADRLRRGFGSRSVALMVCVDGDGRSALVLVDPGISGAVAYARELRGSIFEGHHLDPEGCRELMAEEADEVWFNMPLDERVTWLKQECDASGSSDLSLALVDDCPAGLVREVVETYDL